jgi:uncharacterized membrane protein
VNKSRLEAFSDGVLAIIITIMVLELKVPHGDSISVLRPIFPIFLAYGLSFLYVGIYWTNHHHLVHTVKHVGGRLLWANLHLLFWLSLLPVTTAWVGAYPHSAWPAALYGIVLFGAAIAWLILEHFVKQSGGPLEKIVGFNWKAKGSALLYAAGIGLAFVHPFIAHGVFAVIAAFWFIPDPRIERGVSSSS